MHSTQIALGEIAALIDIATIIPYVWSTLKGHTRPSRASYGIWAVIQTVGLISYIAAGATTTIWALCVLTFNAFVIFGLSFKYGMGGRNKFDIPCLLLAGVAIFLWITTDNPALAVYLSTFAGFIGYLPTIKKAYLWPDTENILSWSMYVVAATLNGCALTSLRPAIALPPLCGLGLSVIVTSLLIFPHWKLMKVPRKHYNSAISETRLV